MAWTVRNLNPGSPVFIALLPMMTEVLCVVCGVHCDLPPTIFTLATIHTVRYTLSGPYGGTLTTQQYPYDENEDPFIWKSKRGFHALFHANTWGDSRGKVFPVPANAGRLAYSVDGFLWTYSDTPPFNGTVA
jgi:hypothetical protein